MRDVSSLHAKLGVKFELDLPYKKCSLKINQTMRPISPLIAGCSLCCGLWFVSTCIFSGLFGWAYVRAPTVSDTVDTNRVLFPITYATDIPPVIEQFVENFETGNADGMALIFANSASVRGSMGNKSHINGGPCCPDTTGGTAAKSYFKDFLGRSGRRIIMCPLCFLRITLQMQNVQMVDALVLVTDFCESEIETSDCQVAGPVRLSFLVDTFQNMILHLHGSGSILEVSD